jgi:hypothetical protein
MAHVHLVPFSLPDPTIGVSVLRSMDHHTDYHFQSVSTTRTVNMTRLDRVSDNDNDLYSSAKEPLKVDRSSLAEIWAHCPHFILKYGSLSGLGNHLVIKACA